MNRPTSAEGSTAPESLHPGMTLSQYQLIRELGRGGMGAVYLARDTRLGRRVAIKFLAQEDQRLAERFMAEARVTARCKHDNIVDIYDVGETTGHSYMVLEYLQGVTMRQWLRDRWQSLEIDHRPGADESHRLVATSPGIQDAATAQVSPTQAVELIVPVVRALAHAHAQGLVHRDLKPENIMLADDGTIKVLDFGIAKVIAHLVRSTLSIQISLHTLSRADSLGVSRLRSELGAETRASTVIGTLPYMSPEQWGVGELDARTDIWSLGIMLWELCTGRHPLAPLTTERLQSIHDVDMPMPSLVDKYPQLGTLAGIVDRCLRKRTTERIPSTQALLAELELLLPGRGRRSRPGADQPDNPYVGLASFQREDTERFFGRDRDINSMMARLRNHRLITVAGPSGSGKSSLIRAGVIPALERSGQVWESFTVRPGRRPLSALADVLDKVSRDIHKSSDGSLSSGANPDVVPGVDSHQTFVEILRTRPGYLGTVLRALCHKRRGRILLFVDQFEELYTLGADRDTREAFVRCVEGVADDASSPLRVVLTVRSDFVDRVAEDRSFTSEITGGMTLLAPLSRMQLRAALSGPLIAGGYRFENQKLLESMLDTLEATRSPLPILQFTAARLWDDRDLRTKHISERSYEAIGGIEGALARHADAVLAALSSTDQRLARRVFTGLVSAERTRTIVSLDELRAEYGAEEEALVDGATGDSIESVVRHLAKARLVLMGTDSERGPTVELIHESLIERWPKLVRWLEEHQDVEQFRNRLREAARQWDGQDRTEDLLWRGHAADEAGRWLDNPAAAADQLSARDHSYLRAVVALARRARRRQRRLTLAGFALVSAVAVAVSLLALRSEREARKATEQAVIADQQADRATRQAAQARNAGRVAAAREYRSDATLVLALIREMEPSGQLPRRWREFARWATHQDVARVVLDHPASVRTAAFSPDGTRIVTAADDHNVRVWRADGSGEPVMLVGHQRVIFAAVFSPDGQRVVTASADDTARVWNADGTGTIAVFRGHQEPVVAVAFRPDGKRVVSASLDKTARIWNADGIGAVTVLSGHRDAVHSAMFSPDGARIVTGSRDETARVWNATGVGDPVVLDGHRDAISNVAFSPDGTRVVTAAWDGTVRVWQADGTGRAIVLRGHQSAVMSAAFSPEGTRIASASMDRTLRIWNADGTGAATVIAGHRDVVYSARYSPDGKHLVSASQDGSVRLWTVGGTDKPIRLKGHQKPIYSVEFSPDGTRIATASGDGTARVWRVDGTGEPIVLKGHEGAIHGVSFSPDSTRIATASRDRTVRLWNSDGTGEPLVFHGHRDVVNSVAFNPDGTRLVSASRDSTVRIWNSDQTGEPFVFRGHHKLVNSASFSPDGTLIVSASNDRTVQVWNASGKGPITVLSGHADGVFSAAFSPDSLRVLSTSDDKSARLWWLGRKTSDGKTYSVELLGHEAMLAGSGSGAGRGAFSSDGQRVVTIADDETVRVWNADGTGEPALLRIPELDAYVAAFSPDGTRIATASRGEHNPRTDEMEHWATVWPTFEQFTGLDDPALWLPTSYCPSVAARVELLNLSQELATRQFADCRARVTKYHN